VSDPKLLHPLLVEASRVIVEAEREEALTRLKVLRASPYDEGTFELAQDDHMRARDAVAHAREAFHATWRLLALGVSDTKDTKPAAVGIAASDTKGT